MSFKRIIFLNKKILPSFCLIKFQSSKSTWSTNTNKTNYNFLNSSMITLKDDKICLADKYKSFTYKEILTLSRNLSSRLVKERRSNFKSEKVAIYCSNNYTYLISILAVWMANGVPFCLSKNFPSKFIEYYLNDSGCKVVINSIFEGESDTDALKRRVEFDEMLKRKTDIQNFKLNENFYSKSIIYDENDDDNKCKEVVRFDEFVASLCSNEKNREAFLLYTSGTSGPAKGFDIVYIILKEWLYPRS